MRVLCCVLLTMLTEATKLKPQPPKRGPEQPLLPRAIDVDPPSYSIPVPFGHIYKDGFGDTGFGLKSPIDLLEYDLRAPINAIQAKKMLENADPSKIHFYANPHSPLRARLESPRDKIVRELGIRQPVTLKNETLRWYDLPELQSRNLMQSALGGAPPRPNSRIPMPPKQSPSSDRVEDFGKLKYNELYAPPQRQNFTTCDEFGVRAYFYPTDVVNLDWIPFYIWSYNIRHGPIKHKFTYVTKKFASTYRELYASHKNIEWNRPKLMMKGKGEFLLISADKKGLFHALQIVTLPENFATLNLSLPYTTLRMKIVDPYLVLMFCEEKYATIMAVESNVPPTEKEKYLEAESIGFHGPGAPVVKTLADELREEMERMGKLTAISSSTLPNRVTIQTPLPDVPGEPPSDFMQ